MIQRMERSATCPRCAGAMGPHTHAAGLDLERCGDCGGLFCTSENFQALLTTDGTESLDTLPRAKGGSEHSDSLDCPRCTKKMVMYRYPPQPHIRIDRCVDCLGVFLDAGELTDMKRYTLLDWFRDLPYR